MPFCAPCCVRGAEKIVLLCCKSLALCAKPLNWSTVCHHSAGDPGGGAERAAKSQGRNYWRCVLFLKTVNLLQSAVFLDSECVFFSSSLLHSLYSRAAEEKHIVLLHVRFNGGTRQTEVVGSPLRTPAPFFVAQGFLLLLLFFLLPYTYSLCLSRNQHASVLAYVIVTRIHFVKNGNPGKPPVVVHRHLLAAH